MKQYVLSEYTDISIKLSELDPYKNLHKQCKNNIQELIGVPITSSTGEIVGEIIAVNDDYIFGRVKTQSLEIERKDVSFTISDIPKSVEHYNKLIKFEEEYV